jgi:hypothetical protein
MPRTPHPPRAPFSQVEGRHDTVLFLRNNLTVVEPVWIYGDAEGPSLLLLDPPSWDHYQRTRQNGAGTRTRSRAFLGVPVSVGSH